jgi:epoxide hydrolase-like predicted phosphatase
MDNDLKIRAVVWDLGGVILRTLDWSGRIRWEERLKLEPFALSELVFKSGTARKASVGKANAADVWQWIGEHLGIEERQLIEMERDFWSGDELDENLIAFIRRLRPKYKTGLLSNGWPDTSRALDSEWLIADAFDAIVVSADVGMVKPDPRIYHLILERLNVSPAHAVLIDDFEENINGARQVGMHAIHFQSPEQAISALRSLIDFPS